MSENKPNKAGVVRDRLIGPLALGLDTEVTTDLGEGDLHASAANKPAPEIERIHLDIGAEQRLRTDLIRAVAHQHIAE